MSGICSVAILKGNKFLSHCKLPSFFLKYRFTKIHQQMKLQHVVFQMTGEKPKQTKKIHVKKMKTDPRPHYCVQRESLDILPWDDSFSCLKLVSRNVGPPRILIPYKVRVCVALVPSHLFAPAKNHPVPLLCTNNSRMKPSEIIHLPIETLLLSAGWRLNVLPRGLQHHAFQKPSSPTAVFFSIPSPRSTLLPRAACAAAML